MTETVKAPTQTAMQSAYQVIQVLAPRMNTLFFRDDDKIDSAAKITIDEARAWEAAMQAHYWNMKAGMNNGGDDGQGGT